MPAKKTAGAVRATPSKPRRGRSKPLRLGAFKLKELARLEGIHYQTALYRAKKGAYVRVVIRTGESGKEAFRYLTAEGSRILLDALAALLRAGIVPDLCPAVPPPQESPAEPESIF